MNKPIKHVLKGMPTGFYYPSEVDPYIKHLEQRAEAAEAQLAELAKQEPVGYTYNCGINFEIVEADLNDDCPCGVDLYTRAAPAAVPVDVVPDAFQRDAAFDDDSLFDNGVEHGWNACRAATLRRIEELKK